MIARLLCFFSAGTVMAGLVGCGGDGHPTGKAAMVAAPSAALPPSLGANLRPGVAQLGAELEWFEIPGEEGLFHRGQKSRDGYLLLTPNEGFFPRLGLTAAGEGNVPDQEKLNGGRSFAFIKDWDADDVAEWGVWLKPGQLVLRVWMSAESPGGGFELACEDQRFDFEPPAAAAPTRVREVACDITDAGRRIIRVTCRKGAALSARLHWIELSGSAVADGMVLRKRWRPAAAHTRFTSSAVPDGVRMWIMEMDAVPGELGFYAPITTPFGYYGPTWLADGRVNTGMNFSLWSYGRKEQAPPIGELSHLLAIGNRDAKFGGFGHEGTGVKIRDWEPLKGHQGQSQAFALRVDPGRDFNTFYSYFFAPDEQRWRLFGVGRQKPKRRPLTHLTLGSFVEVPGPPQRQRTGSTVRRMRYRGWVSRDGSEWSAIDTMKIGDVDKATGLTYTDRGLDDDGWFFMQTGGWVYRKAPASDVSRSDESGALPTYLQPERREALLELPAAIAVESAERQGGMVKLNYRVRGIGTDAEVLACFGADEGMTFAERWQNRVRLPTPVEGDNVATLEIGDGRAKLRLLLRNDSGQFWTFQTTSVQ